MSESKKTQRIYVRRGGQIYDADRDPSTGDYDLGGETSAVASASETEVLKAELVRPSKAEWAGNGNSVSVEDVYNKISLTCDVESAEDLIESPLDDDSIVGVAANKQRYCDELVSFGEGKKAWNAFQDLCADRKTSYSPAHVVKWYAQTFKSKNWTFSGDQWLSKDGTRQTDAFKELARKPCVAFLCSLGKEDETKANDDSLSSKIDMTRYLVVSVNGNEKDSESAARPSDSDLQAAYAEAPVARYVGNLAGGYFSPADSSTTNYIVISGKMVLQAAKLKPSGGYWWKSIRQLAKNDPTVLWHQTVHLNDSSGGDGSNPDGAYYAVRWYDDETPFSDEKVRDSDVRSLIPHNSSWQSMTDLKYNYSAVGDSTDRFFKLPVLQCTLKIGDKYCCEIFKEDGPSEFVWRTLADCPTETYDGKSYPANHIYIGVNPAIGDDFVGKEFDVVNTVVPKMNVDAEGTAIPVRADDALRGKVEFTIDGPVNSTWTEITRKHPTFFKHTKWRSNSKSVLAHVSAIFISNFEIKIYSDNGLLSTGESDSQKDLVYSSDVSPKDYVNVKDDVDFSLATSLTASEAASKGLSGGVWTNSPIGPDGKPLRSVWNSFTGDSGKPEEHYISDYWREYSEPKALVDCEVPARKGWDWTTHFRLTGMGGRDFYVRSAGWDVRREKKILTLKEGRRERTVEFVDEDGSVVERVKGMDGDPLSAPEAPAKGDRRFVRWEGAGDRIDGDATYRAVYEDPADVVDKFYDSDGAILYWASGKPGAKYSAPETPSREDSGRFKAWAPEPDWTFGNEGRSFKASYYRKDVTLKLAGSTEEWTFVDLGLPSGTMWRIQNFGTGLGSKWGAEWDGTDDALKRDSSSDKYLRYNETDKLEELLPQDDYVSQRLGDRRARIASKAQWEELAEAAGGTKTPLVVNGQQVYIETSWRDYVCYWTRTRVAGDEFRAWRVDGNANGWGLGKWSRQGDNEAYAAVYEPGGKDEPQVVASFLGADGKVLAARNGWQGDPLSAPEPQDAPHRRFKSWSPEPPASFPETDSEYASLWDEDPKYSQKFLDRDGNVLKTLEDYAGEPLSAPDAPEVDGWKFKEWSPAVPAEVPAEDRTYRATYEPAGKYAVTFKDFGGNVLKTVRTDGRVEPSQMPDAPKRSGQSLFCWTTMDKKARTTGLDYSKYSWFFPSDGLDAASDLTLRPVYRATGDDGSWFPRQYSDKGKTFPIALDPESDEASLDVTMTHFSDAPASVADKRIIDCGPWECSWYQKGFFFDYHRPTSSTTVSGGDNDARVSSFGWGMADKLSGKKTTITFNVIPSAGIVRTDWLNESDYSAGVIGSAAIGSSSYRGPYKFQGHACAWNANGFSRIVCRSFDRSETWNDVFVLSLYFWNGDGSGGAGLAINFAALYDAVKKRLFFQTPDGYDAYAMDGSSWTWADLK